MSELADRLRGRFIVLDGPDGSGKSTQLALLAEHLAGYGAQVHRAHDPGGTVAGDHIRGILLDRHNSHLGPMCEVLLFMASRAQLIEEKVRPALAAGNVVLCDRFVSATVAYQGALGVPAETIIQLGQFAVQGAWPDLTVILDVPVRVGMARIGVPRGKRKKPHEPTGRTLPLFGDRMESRHLEYDQAVRRNFLKLCKPGAYPGAVARVDGRGPKGEVFAAILAELERAFCPPPEDP